MNKNMKENFEKLNSRIKYSLENSDLERINYELNKISTPTLVSGVGGSSVVSEYTSKILSNKNNIITKNIEPRDILYINEKLYNNIISCSYSGNNYGVEISFLNNLKHYLLSYNKNDDNDIINLNYNIDEKEKSFISLSSTLIPCGILLNYYIDNKDLIIENTKEYDFNFDTNCDAYEIFTGIESSTISKYLESTMIESGIGVPIIHDKYSYCHGRSTISTTMNNNAIYIKYDNELDKLLLEELPKYYKNVIVLDSNNNPLDEYILLVKSMYLTKYIAENKNKDLSNVEYNPITKKLYKYRGNM